MEAAAEEDAEEVGKGSGAEGGATAGTTAAMATADAGAAPKSASATEPASTQVKTGQQQQQQEQEQQQQLLLRRRDLAAHVVECGWRRVACPFCAAPVPALRVDAHAASDACPSRPLRCPLPGCGMDGFKGPAALAVHADTDCPVAEVQCPVVSICLRRREIMVAS